MTDVAVRDVARKYDIQQSVAWNYGRCSGQRSCLKMWQMFW